MNTEAMTRYADAVCMKYETEQRVSGQEKQAMADRKFFSGTDFDLMLFAKEKIEFLRNCSDTGQFYSDITNNNDNQC